MLTPEQLKNYREQLSQHFSKIDSEKLDTRGIIGSLLTALGIERASVIPDAVKRLNFAKADAKKNWKSQFDAEDLKNIKPFDILLRTSAGTGELEPPSVNMNHNLVDDITGKPLPPESRVSRFGRSLYQMAAGNRDNHAYVVLPYDVMEDGKKVTKLMPTIIGNLDKELRPMAAPVPSWGRALVAQVENYPNLVGSQGFFGGTRRFIDKVRQQYRKDSHQFAQARKAAPRTKTWEDLVLQSTSGGDPNIKSLKDLGGLDDFMQPDQSTYRFLRFKDELNPQEIEEVKRRLMSGIQDRTFKPADNNYSGIKNFLFGPGKAGKKFTDAPIPTCSGGVCHIFEGMRDMPSISRALPQDLATAPSLREVGNFYLDKATPKGKPGPAAGWSWVDGYPTYRQTQDMVSKNSIRAARRALGTRFGMAAAPLGVGGYMLGSSPTFQNMVQPLAEQSKLIGQKVQDYVNKARNYGS